MTDSHDPDPCQAGLVPVQPTADRGPARLHRLPGRAWLAAAGRAATSFGGDDLSDWAAALTYYGILAVFPGLLLVVTVLRLAGTGTATAVVDNIAAMAPGAVHDILGGAADSLQHSRQGASGVIAIVSLAGALWSASGYVGAFMRASNAIYDVPEGRPIWKRLPIRIGLTVATGVLLTASAVIVVFTGRLARSVGDALGIGHTAVTIWGIAKWPVLVAIVAVLFDLLYWASPNARQGFRWVSPGGVLAVIIWLAASGGFAVYVTHFASYNRTYGSIAAVIVFLVWLWISNLAVLLGAEFDAELQRGRAIQAGHRPQDEPYLRLRSPVTPDPPAPGGGG
ncbi:YihY/virulence factor BrkB family protein [Rugosimonospora acidiphila]|uniref:YihY/virulence factor BrkB family protein n=1 Tax=Rugosimonospora acidiphila TaxID=556531 RepID=A0ABP9SK45_9ACTN